MGLQYVNPPPLHNQATSRRNRLTETHASPMASPASVPGRTDTAAVASTACRMKNTHGCTWHGELLYGESHIICYYLHNALVKYGKWASRGAGGSGLGPRARGATWHARPARDQRPRRTSGAGSGARPDGRDVFYPCLWREPVLSLFPRVLGSRTDCCSSPSAPGSALARNTPPTHSPPSRCMHGRSCTNIAQT